ncbi:hypothetical protein L1987_60643 [Smallanthus sonchifolius]|uniref:Uncharacterized protein n=1 Tax=Smallanthus sonchifolius TaxID=185202 RepID=A0ACB9D8K0_9ASTR|nr:hypothetical protein L1987_60643 [Smallanthus sonchifolius]
MGALGLGDGLALVSPGLGKSDDDDVITKRGIVTQFRSSKLGLDSTKVDWSPLGGSSDPSDIDVLIVCLHGPSDECVLGLHECSWDYTGKVAV